MHQARALSCLHTRTWRSIPSVQTPPHQPCSIFFVVDIYSSPSSPDQSSDDMVIIFDVSTIASSASSAFSHDRTASWASPSDVPPITSFPREVPRISTSTSSTSCSTFTKPLRYSPWDAARQADIATERIADFTQQCKVDVDITFSHSSAMSVAGFNRWALPRPTRPQFRAGCGVWFGGGRRAASWPCWAAASAALSGAWSAADRGAPYTHRTSTDRARHRRSLSGKKPHGALAGGRDGRSDMGTGGGEVGGAVGGEAAGAVGAAVGAAPEAWVTGKSDERAKNGRGWPRGGACSASSATQLRQRPLAGTPPSCWRKGKLIPRPRSFVQRHGWMNYPWLEHTWRPGAVGEWPVGRRHSTMCRTHACPSKPFSGRNTAMGIRCFPQESTAGGRPSQSWRLATCASPSRSCIAPEWLCPYCAWPWIGRAGTYTIAPSRLCCNHNQGGSFRASAVYPPRPRPPRLCWRHLPARARQCCRCRTASKTRGCSHGWPRNRWSTAAQRSYTPPPGEERWW